MESNQPNKIENLISNIQFLKTRKSFFSSNLEASEAIKDHFNSLITKFETEYKSILEKIGISVQTKNQDHGITLRIKFDTRTHRCTQINLVLNDSHLPLSTISIKYYTGYPNFGDDDYHLSVQFPSTLVSKSSFELGYNLSLDEKSVSLFDNNKDEYISDEDFIDKLLTNILIDYTKYLDQ